MASHRLASLLALPERLLGLVPGDRVLTMAQVIPILPVKAVALAAAYPHRV
jgi:hypothetical protein